MAVAKTLFKTHAFHGNAKVSEIMGRVNQELSRANPWQMFVTALPAFWMLIPAKSSIAMVATSRRSSSGPAKKGRF